MSTTPQLYEITVTGVYRTTDLTEAYRLVAGSQIPMSLAIRMGLDDAGYISSPLFDPAQEAAIVALIAQHVPLVLGLPDLAADEEETLMVTIDEHGVLGSAPIPDSE